MTNNGKKPGDLLVRRRTELNPAWRTRSVFTEANNLTLRVVSAMENGKRANFKPGTIVALEVAYQLAPGSLRRLLAGGDLELAPGPHRPRPGRFTVIQGDGGQLQHSRDLDPRILAVMRELNTAIEAKRESNPAASGADIFDDQVLAEIWDIPIPSEVDRLIPMAAYVVVRRGDQGTHRAG